jgi:hypothetical protein
MSNNDSIKWGDGSGSDEEFSLDYFTDGRGWKDETAYVTFSVVNFGVH